MANLVDTLDKIERLRGEWQGLQPISKENEERLWKKFRLEWNFNSNHIEGNTLTYGETQLLLLFDKTTGDHEMREFEEMKAHDVAIQAIKDWAADKNRELTESDIRDLNRIILVRPYWKEALTYDGQATRRMIKVGEYKEHPNSVRLANGEMFHYAKPDEVSIKMKELLDWYRNNQDLSPAILAAEIHYRFILIHPFDDGNGRIARLLVNYIFIRNGLLPIIIKSDDKKNYLTALNKADVGNREAFHEYIAEQLVWSFEIAIKAAKGESVEEDDDIDKEIELLARQAIKSKIVTRKSKEIIHETYLSLLTKIYALIESKFKKFNPLFVESSKTIVVLNKNGDNLGFSSELSDLENILKNPIITLPDDDPNNFYSVDFDDTEVASIKMHFYWNGYKNSGLNNTFGINCSFVTRFDDFSYKIAFSVFNQDDMFSIEVPYGHILTGEEDSTFVNQAAKDVLELIKVKAGN